MQKFLLFVAPLLVGGDDAPSLLAGQGPTVLAASRRFHFSSVKRIGPDVLLTAYFEDAAR